jgi:hypothetical protein
MRFGSLRCRSLEIFAIFVSLLASQVSCSTATADPPPTESLGPAGTNVRGFGAHDASALTNTGGTPVFGAFEAGVRAIHITPGTAVLEVDPSSGRSATGDRCGPGSDCCNDADRCINAVCSLVLH